MNNTWKENNTLIKIKEYYDEVTDENYGAEYEYPDDAFPETESYPIDHGYFVVALTEDDLNLLKSDDHKKQKDALTRAYFIDAYIADYEGDYAVAPLDSHKGEDSKKEAIKWFKTDFAQKVSNTKPSKDWKFVLIYLEGEDLLAGLTWKYDYYDICVAMQTYWDPAEYETRVIEDSIRICKDDYFEIAGDDIQVKESLKAFRELKDKEALEGWTLPVLEDDSWVEDDSHQANFKIIDELTR